MVAPEKKEIKKNVNDIRAGISAKAPKRVLYRELSELAGGTKGNGSPIEELAKSDLRGVATEIHTGILRERTFRPETRRKS